MPQPGDPIPLSDAQRTALGHNLVDVLGELEREHAVYFKDISRWWDWYHAVPDVPVRSEPWPGASNLVVPVIAMQADAMVARMVLQIFGTGKLWIGTTENSKWSPILASIFEFLNYSSRKGMGADTFDHVEPALVEQQVIGRAYLYQTWDNRERWIVPPNSKKPQLVSIGAGPKLTHIPQERVLAMRDVPIHESDLVAIQSHFTWNALTREAKRNDWSSDAMALIEGHSGLVGPAARIREERRRRQGLTPTETIRSLQPHDVREVWVDYPFVALLDRSLRGISGVRFQEHEADEVTVPIVVTLHPQTREVLHARYSPYLLDRWPIYEIVRKRGGTREEMGRGLAKDLEHPQRGISTVVNQGIDSVTFGNSLKVFTSDRDLEGKRWVPNKLNYTTDVNRIKEMTGAKNVASEIAIANILQAVSERIGGQPDPALGREIRQGGHPQPATNFLGLIQQSQITSSRSVVDVRRALSKIGEHRAVLYQQFERNRNGWISRVFGEEDAPNIMRWLDSPEPLIGQITFDVHALSEIHNPDAERQKAVVIDQMVTNHYGIVAQFLQAMENPQTPPSVKAALQKAVEAKGQSLINFLEASDIDDIDQYVERFRANQGANIDLVNQLAGFLQQGGAQGALGAAGGNGSPRALSPGGAQPAPEPGVVPLPRPAARDAGRSPRGGGSAFTG